MSVYPKALPEKYRRHWDYPWKARARLSPGFRSWLDKNGYLSPHFKLREAASHDGQPVPGRLNRRARDHAFQLERLRHKLNDRPMAVTSWYRSPAHNRAVGGAAKSKHMEAIATDHPKHWVDTVGRARVLKAAEEVFKSGGIGTYPGGAVHLDNRGLRARWSSWVPGR